MYNVHSTYYVLYNTKYKYNQKYKYTSAEKGVCTNWGIYYCQIIHFQICTSAQYYTTAVKTAGEINAIY